MIHPSELFELLKLNGVTFYTGVPDSLLKEFCSYVNDNAGEGNHIITANEGAAVALAAGRYLAEGRPALVYMQNSGLGNSVNPLLSLADREVYSIPMLLMIGWRGEPGRKDEPQHKKQGRVMLKMLDAMEIKYVILEDEIKNASAQLELAVKVSISESCPYAIIVREGTFEKYKAAASAPSVYKLKREDAIATILQSIDSNDIVVSTTGKISREVLDYRKSAGDEPGKDFLTVGSMGHSSQIALGIACSKPNRKVYVLDGDGAVIMHMGSLSVTGNAAPPNFCHIVLNNGAHESVGGQPTSAFSTDLKAVAAACGYSTSLRAESIEELQAAIDLLGKSKGHCFLEVRVSNDSKNDLPRPDKTPLENKEMFMKFVSGESD